MVRKLKVFQTSLGFFDLAIAAPSMKAALDAWGADSNLFHQGVARESNDRAVVAAAMSKPGVILRRPVGSDGPFGEDADLPTSLPGAEAGQKPRKQPRSKPKRQPIPPKDDKAARKAAEAFEREERQRERERRKDEAAREKQLNRRRQAVAEAEAALQAGNRAHDEKAAAIAAERDVLDRQLEDEQARWEKARAKLQSALKRARDQD